MHFVASNTCPRQPSQTDTMPIIGLNFIVSFSDKKCIFLVVIEERQLSSYPVRPSDRWLGSWRKRFINWNLENITYSKRQEIDQVSVESEYREGLTSGLWNEIIMVSPITNYTLTTGGLKSPMNYCFSPVILCPRIDYTT